MWPDVCSEALGKDQDHACAEIIEDKCELGDHRRCDPANCEFAAVWHEIVRAAGIEAAEAAGKIWAVVSVIEDQPTVVGTGDHLGRAKSLLRTGHAKKFGIQTGDPAAKGLVYIVRGADGGFF